MEEDHPDFMECIDQKGKMNRLLREKALKKPTSSTSQEQVEEKSERMMMMNRPNGALTIRERNEEEEEKHHNVTDQYQQQEVEEEEEVEKVIINTEKALEKCSLWPVRIEFDKLIVAAWDELDERWEEIHGNNRAAAVADLEEEEEGGGDALPNNFMALIREMNGTDLILVLEKQLFETDIRKVENRLSIPANQIREKFLTEEEEGRLRSGEGMKVVLIQPSLQVCTITLKMWKMKRTCYLYVLTSKWNSVVQTNFLETEDPVQIWSFRVGRELRFALVRV